MEGGAGCGVEIKGAFGTSWGWWVGVGWGGVKGREPWFSLEVKTPRRLVVEGAGEWEVGDGGGVHH